MSRCSFLFVVATLVAACGGDRTEQARRASADSLRSAVAVEVRRTSAQDEAREAAELERRRVEVEAARRERCAAAAAVPEALDRIIAEPKHFVGSDSCARALMDEIVARFIRTDEERYLDALDALSRTADSKATEMLGNAVLDLFRARPVELVRHLYMLQGDPMATEVDALLVTEIQLGRNGTFDDEIHSILERLDRGKDLSTDQKRYLARIESQFWASAR